MDTTAGLVGILVGLTVIIGATYGGWRALGPGARKWSAAGDVLVGKAPVLDDSGSVIEEGQPGIVQVMRIQSDRLAIVEDAVQTLVGERLTAIERVQTTHSARLTSLERHEEERIEMRRENTALFNAVAERDTINGEATE